MKNREKERLKKQKYRAKFNEEQDKQLNQIN